MLQKPIWSLGNHVSRVLEGCNHPAWLISWLFILGLISGAVLEPAPAAEAFPLGRKATLSPLQLVAIDHPQAGNSIAVHGAVLPIPWIKTEERIAIADYALADHFGATFIDTDDWQNQPVQWFTPAGQPSFNLQTQLDSGYRFLDITDVAAQHNWNLVPQGNTLQITQLPTQLQAIRYEPYPWGDRLILSVTGATLARLSEENNEFSLVLQASSNRQGMNTLPDDFPGTAITSIDLNPEPNQTTLTVQTNANVRPILSTLGGPDRIVVDIRKDSLQPRNILWAPGLRWRQAFLSVGGTPFPVYWLQLNPRQGNINLRPIWTDPVTATGITPLITMAQRWQAAAAINGGFFNRNNQYPLGAVRFENSWISGPILSRGVIGWDANGNTVMRRLFLSQTLTTSTGASFPIQALNSGYVQAGIGLYTPTWGPQYRPILDNEILVTVVNGQVIHQQQVTSAEAVPIPEAGYVLALRSFETAARALPPGTQVALQSELLPSELSPFPNIVGGGPLLLQNSSVVLNAGAEQFSSAFATQAAPRSAIGLNRSGELLLVAAHTNSSGRGPTLSELAQIMIQLGSVDALNLDGGSSASLYLGGRLLNRNPRTAARVNNSIGLFLD
jgi:hypothetical protein